MSAELHIVIQDGPLQADLTMDLEALESNTNSDQARILLEGLLHVKQAFAKAQFDKEPLTVLPEHARRIPIQ